MASRKKINTPFAAMQLQDAANLPALDPERLTLNMLNTAGLG